MARAAPLLDYRDGLVDAAAPRHVVKVAASWSPQNYFNACGTPVASREPEGLLASGLRVGATCWRRWSPRRPASGAKDETQPI